MRWDCCGSCSEAAGAEVITSSSAEAALDQVADAKPHVLVVDLGMPTVDGFQFISRLRGSATRRSATSRPPR